MSEIHESTHWLKCRQGLGRSSRDYLMACNILEKRSGGRIKIEVFGTRDWGGHERRVRTVDRRKVEKREDL